MYFLLLFLVGFCTNKGIISVDLGRHDQAILSVYACVFTWIYSYSNQLACFLRSNIRAKVDLILEVFNSVILSDFLGVASGSTTQGPTTEGRGNKRRFFCHRQSIVQLCNMLLSRAYPVVPLLIR